MGLGIIASGAKLVTDEMFLRAARTLAELVSPEDLSKNCIYPPLANIRTVSARIAAAAAEVAYLRNLAREPKPENLLEYIQSRRYDPHY